MKKINVTFSIPDDTHKLLQALVGRKKMSYFVSNAINKALENEVNELKKAYKLAENDLDRKKTLKDWEAFDYEDWNE